MSPLSDHGNTALDRVPDQVRSIAECSPHTTAIASPEGEWTYAEVLASVDTKSQRLVEAGATAGAVVMIEGIAGRTTAEWFLAVTGLGAVYVPVDPAMPDARIDAIVRQLEGSRLLTVIDGDEIVMRDERPPLPSFADDTAYILFTSGSTGVPKGVVVGHSALAIRIQEMSELLAARPVRVPFLASPSFDMSIAEMLIPLTTGGVLLCGTKQQTLLTEVWDLAPTMVQGTPTLWKLLDITTPGPWPFDVWCGGEALSPGLAERLCERSNTVYNMYGPTEAVVYVSATKVAPGAPVAIDRAFPSVDLRVDDTGELIVAGHTLAAGYLSPPPSGSPFGRDAHGTPTYRTGDIVSVDRDGRMTFDGRMDTQVKVRGYRIELGEIEDAAESHPGVDAACAITATWPASGEKTLVLFVAADAGLHEEDIAAHLERKVPQYMIPGFVVLRETLPITTSSKIDRVALARDAAALVDAE